MSVPSNHVVPQQEVSTYAAWRPVIAARRHAISTGHYLATQAGFQVLEAGGNAVDAGVAAALVLTVVHSDQVNAAGVAPMLIYVADRGEIITIDGVGTWPAAVRCEMFEVGNNGQIPEDLRRTVVPAAPAAWIEALQRFGTMSFGDVAQYAVRFAREGFVMYPFMAEQIALSAAKIARWPANAEIYLSGGRPPTPGDLFVQSDLASSLQYMIDEEAAALASDAGRRGGLQAARDAFYRGDLMRKIVDFHAANGGLLTERDMADYQVRLSAALSTRAYGYDVYSCGFWCQGPALLQTLNIVKGLDLKSMGHNSTAYVHHIAEALKLVFADREAYYGDPDVIDVPAAMLLSEDYAAARRAEIRADKAWPELPAAGGPATLRGSFEVGKSEQSGPFDTSYVGVVDSHGNAVSINPSDVCFDTQIIPGTGLAPSSRGSQSWADARHPSSVAPGKRPRLTPNPAMIMTPGKLTMPIGTPGGDAQVQAMVQVLLNMMVFGMDPQTAIEAPRFITRSHPDSFSPHLAYPGQVGIEARIGAETRAALESLGHKVLLWPERHWRAAGVCLVRHDHERGLYEAAADPRRAAAAAQGW